MTLPQTALQARRSVAECLSSADQILRQVQTARIEAEQRSVVQAAWLRVLALDIRDLVLERRGEDLSSVRCFEETDWENAGLLDAGVSLEELAKRAHALAQSQRARQAQQHSSISAEKTFGPVEQLGIRSTELRSVLERIELDLLNAQQERTRLVEKVESIVAELHRCATLLQQARGVANSALQEARKWRQRALAQQEALGGPQTQVSSGGHPR